LPLSTFIDDVPNILAWFNIVSYIPLLTISLAVKSRKPNIYFFVDSYTVFKYHFLVLVDK